jgi:WhiB family redox-sensing transcriptional regulator
VENNGLGKQSREARVEIVETWSLLNKQFDWMEDAECVGMTDLFFIETRGYAKDKINQAKQVCNRCPVRVKCITFALDNRMEYGIWGGKTSIERDRILARRRK